MRTLCLIAFIACCIGCVSTRNQSGIITDMWKQNGAEQCYGVAGQVVCHPIHEVYYIELENGAKIAVYEETWNKYRIGQYYP